MNYMTFPFPEGTVTYKEVGNELQIVQLQPTTFTLIIYSYLLADCLEVSIN